MFGSVSHRFYDVHARATEDAKHAGFLHGDVSGLEPTLRAYTDEYTKSPVLNQPCAQTCITANAAPGIRVDVNSGQNTDTHHRRTTCSSNSFAVSCGRPRYSENIPTLFTRSSPLSPSPSACPFDPHTCRPLVEAMVRFMYVVVLSELAVPA